MFTNSAPVSKKRLSYLSLVWCSVFPPSPHLVENEWCEGRQRGIHRVLNYLPRIVHLPVHHSKLDSPSPHRLAPAVRGYPTHYRPLRILSASDRLECSHLLTRFLVGTHLPLAMIESPPAPNPIRTLLAFPFFSPNSPCCWFRAYRRTMQQIVSRISAGHTPF